MALLRPPGRQAPCLTRGFAPRLTAGLPLPEGNISKRVGRVKPVVLCFRLPPLFGGYQDLGSLGIVDPKVIVTLVFFLSRTSHRVVAVRHLFEPRGPMMTVPLHSRRNGGGCPIINAVRRPVSYPGSPPHAMLAQDFEVIDLVSPDVVHDLGQAPRRGHAGNLLPLASLHEPEPRPKGAGAPGGLRPRAAHRCAAFSAEIRVSPNPVSMTITRC